MIYDQGVLGTLAFALLILGYCFLFLVWKFTRNNLVPVVRYFLLAFIMFMGTLKSIDFIEGVNLLDKYFLANIGLMLLIYFNLIGFRMHMELTYSWRIEKLRNIFNWQPCRLSIDLLRKMVNEKKAHKELQELKEEMFKNQEN